MCGGLEKLDIFNSFSFQKSCGGLERTNFELSPLWESVVVLKELIFNNISLWQGVVVLKKVITFNTFSLWEGDGGL